MTQEKYDKRVHGRSSLANPATEALREEWRMAGEMPPGPPPPGEWVPRDSVYVRADILPRADDYLDFEKVREYSQVFRDLPPIRVQRDTFVLIDGRHRLNAAYESAANSVCIRIVEVDVPDGELREAAFDANASHGVQYRPKDRLEYLKYLLLTKKDSRPDVELARACGLSRSAVMENRHKWLGRMRDYSVERFANSNNPSSTEPAKSQSDNRADATNSTGQKVTRERLAGPEWPDDDLPARDVEDGEDWPEEDVREPDDLADEGGERAAEGFAPPRSDAPPTGVQRGPLPAAPPPGYEAQADLGLVVAWFQAMPDVGDAEVIVGAIQPGDMKRFAYWLAGARSLCDDLHRVMVVAEALA